MTQSAVSQLLRRLERSLNVSLIVKGKRNFALTREGNIFYEGMLSVVGKYHDTIKKIQRNVSRVPGSVVVATTYIVGLYDLPLPLEIFKRKFPSVEIFVRYREAVSQGLADVVGIDQWVSIVRHDQGDPH